MSFWDGNRWVSEPAVEQPPAPSRRTNWAATALMLLGLLAIAIPLQLVAAGNTPPGCALSARMAGSSSVVQVDGWGMRHSADYVIRWTEPQITQVQYWWSSSKGNLQQTVLNNQGSGTYTASLYYRGPKGETWEASCSLGV
jgi:hypothetical protein